MIVFILDYLIAMALIVSPLESGKDYSKYKYLSPTIRRIAIDWELIDSRNQWKFKSDHIDSFSSELVDLHEIYEDLKTAPHMSTLLAFNTTEEAINKRLEFNRSYLNNLETEASRYVFNQRPERDWYDATIAETKAIQKVYENMSWANMLLLEVPTKRRYLKSVKEALGDDLFSEGWLPPPVPVWRFKEIE